MKSVLVGMSGGVDSSAAALLLLRAGYAVTGATFRLWDALGDGAEKRAKAVCAALGISHIVLDLRAVFRESVVEPFCAEFRAGRTPNPCVLCNRAVKLGAFADYARENGFDHIATGHYARCGWDDACGRYVLRRAASAKKDQSYFLFRARQEALAMLLLPLADYEKPAIRALAAEAGLPTAAEKDSQDVCFIPDGDYPAFLRGYTGEQPAPGDFIDEAGKVLGRHRGVSGYTIGQRKGLGVALGKPAFVTALDAANGTVTLTTDESRLFRTEVLLGEVVASTAAAFDEPFRAEVKLRSAHSPAPAQVFPQGESARVLFDVPQRAPAPGQSAVFYRGDLLLGGGTIL